MDKKYCSLYVDIRLSENNILDLIREEYGGKRESSYVDCDWAIFDIESNDAYSWFKKRRKDDGFLYYRYVIPVESKMPEESFKVYICNLRRLISILRKKGAKVVPACDFEDELREGCGMRITTKDAEFLSVVSDSLERDGYAIVYVSYIGGAGAEDYFLISSNAELKKVISSLKRRDSVSVFTDKAIPIQGKADSSLQEQALELLSRLQADDSYESVIAVRKDVGHLLLTHEDDWLGLYSPTEIEQWFTQNHGASILVFPPPWNNSEAIEAIVW